MVVENTMQKLLAVREIRETEVIKTRYASAQYPCNGVFIWNNERELER